MNVIANDIEYSSCIVKTLILLPFQFKQNWYTNCGYNHNKTTHVVKKRNFARNSSLKTVRRANLYNFANGLKSETKIAEIRLTHEEAWYVASDWTYRFQHTWKIDTRHLIGFPLLKLACQWAFVSRLFYQRSTRTESEENTIQRYSSSTYTSDDQSCARTPEISTERSIS